jgi:hypothetical protein
MSSDSSVATTLSARARASRINGARSRGPRTAAGKARASRNALRHGLCARTHLLLPDERAADFAAFAAALIAELAPEGPLQTVLAERVAVAAWRLARADRLEAEALAFRMRADGTSARAHPRRRRHARRRDPAALPWHGAGRAHALPAHTPSPPDWGPRRRQPARGAARAAPRPAATQGHALENGDRPLRCRVAGSRRGSEPCRPPSGAPGGRPGNETNPSDHVRSTPWYAGATSIACGHPGSRPRERRPGRAAATACGNETNPRKRARTRAWHSGDAGSDVETRSRGLPERRAPFRLSGRHFDAHGAPGLFPRSRAQVPARGVAAPMPIARHGLGAAPSAVARFPHEPGLRLRPGGTLDRSPARGRMDHPAHRRSDRWNHRN